VTLYEGFFDRSKPLHIRWGDLPHWRQEGALYFVTFRLSDSLPQSKLAAWREEIDRWRRSHPDASPSEVGTFTRRQRRKVERWLDRGYGSCYLRDPKAHAIVESAIRHFDGERYDLGRFTVAANHAHAIVRPHGDFDLSEILHSWKRHTSRQLRRLPNIPPALRRATHLWQVESFDHIVRGQQSLEKITAYIMNHDTNP
jgi:type I restriction enzyme R subunit